MSPCLVLFPVLSGILSQRGLHTDISHNSREAGAPARGRLIFSLGIIGIPLSQEDAFGKPVWSHEDHSHLWWLVHSDPFYLFCYHLVACGSLCFKHHCHRPDKNQKSILPPTYYNTYTHTHILLFFSVLSLRLHSYCCIYVQFAHDCCIDICSVVCLTMWACFWLLWNVFVNTVVLAWRENKVNLRTCLSVLSNTGAVCVVNKPQQ